jgi:hypothetical protein
LRSRRAGKAAGSAKQSSAATAKSAAAPAKPGDTTTASPAPAVRPRPELPRARPVVQLARRPAALPKMVEGLRPGSVLIKEEALQMAPTAVHAQPYCGGWSLVQCDSAGELERAICDRRLDLFKIVGSHERTAFAFGRKQAVTKALSRLLSTVAAQGRNGLEVGRISDLNLLGLHYVTVVGQARHIQARPFVLETAEQPRLARVAQPAIGTEDEHSHIAPAQAA